MEEIGGRGEDGRGYGVGDRGKGVGMERAKEKRVGIEG